MSKTHLYLAFAVLAAGLFGFLIGRNTDIKLEIRSGQHAAKLDVKGGAIDHEKILEAIYANDFLRGAARQWLSDKHGLVAVSDDRLASLIERGSCSNIPSAPIEAKLSALKACADIPRNQQLRDLALVRRGYPFHPVGKETRMSVPENKRDIPARGGANICDRELLGKRIEVYSPRTSKTVYVTPTGYIPCSGIVETGTQLHMNPEDARELLGGVKPTGIQKVYILAAA